MDDARAQSNASRASEAQSDLPADLVEVARIAGAHGVRGWVKIQPFSTDSGVLDSVKTWWLSAPQKPLSKALSDAKSASSVSSVSSSELFPDLTVAQPASVRPYHVVWSKVHGSTWLACLKGLVDRDQAHALKGSSIWVSRKAFPALDDDEYYWIDLIGCQVFSVKESFVDRLEVVSGDEPATVNVAGSQTHFPVSDDDLVPLGIVHSIEENPAHPLLSVLRQEPTESGQWMAVMNARGKPVHTLIPFVAAHVLSVDVQGKRILVDWPADF